MPRGFQLDWVLVRVNTLRRIVAVAVTGILAAALLGFAYVRLHVPPEMRARRTIEAAEVAKERVLDRPVAVRFRSEFEQAGQQLETARVAYADEEWGRAEHLADDARRWFEGMLGDGQRELVGVGRFFSLEGRIQVQRAGRPEWQAADLSMPVFNGDFVKSGRDGSAEIMFNDGTLYRVAPNSLLEVHHVDERRRQEGAGNVTMVTGRLNVYTSASPSTVTTDSTETEIGVDSRVSVDVQETDAGEETTVAAFTGAARVRNRQGDEVLVSSREVVAADPSGRFSSKQRLPDPPSPLEPSNNAAFDLVRQRVIAIRWRTPPGGQRVHLQVSRSQRFGGELDVDAQHLEGDGARLRAILPGTYFWRLASLGRGAVRSEWGPVRRFRVVDPRSRPVMQDEEPPQLVLAQTQQLGHVFILEGTTEVGAQVTVNDEPVEVDADGRFHKTVETTHEGWNTLRVVAVDPFGNRTERLERVYVEVY